MKMTLVTIAAAFALLSTTLSSCSESKKEEVSENIDQATREVEQKMDETKEDFFVHVTGLSGGQIQQNDKVEFDTQEGKKGVNAVNVKKV